MGLLPLPFQFLQTGCHITAFYSIGHFQKQNSIKQSQAQHVTDFEAALESGEREDIVFRDQHSWEKEKYVECFGVTAVEIKKELSGE